ncbi:11256_t:CDS:1 [Paraglomus occultum]|uniref:11256_t:CDS:1 n=1 Tax=Paraglomus occultum TaxID=144539 RepID=A0A9N8Z672_9GLOM|nr:11256_t:CDS:1 [Paraglomus occultum]
MEKRKRLGCLLDRKTTFNKQQSHTALAHELRCLKEVYEDTHPAYKKACVLQEELQGPNHPMLYRKSKNFFSEGVFVFCQKAIHPQTEGYNVVIRNHWHSLSYRGT